MAQEMWIPKCGHVGAVTRTATPECEICGQEHQFDGWYLTMHERMAVYQYVYGLKPIGPHRPLADDVLAGKREPCRSCDGRGIVTLRRADHWALCATCEGTGGHWNCSPEELEALRRRVIEDFPDSGVDAGPHRFVSPGLVHDLGTGTIVDLLREPMAKGNEPQGDDEFEDEFEFIKENGELVFSLEWDSGAPGAGAGIESVYRWNNKFVVSSLDDCNPGPFASLENALEANALLNVNAATRRVFSSLLPTNDLAKQLRCREMGLTILINGETWISSATGRFRRASPDQ